jgi:hypothetical protein
VDRKVGGGNFSYKFSNRLESRGFKVLDVGLTVDIHVLGLEVKF